MTVPARLSRKLREVLGAEAAEDMMALLIEMAAQRQDILGAIQRVSEGVQRIDERVQRIDARVQRIEERVHGVEVHVTKEIAAVRTDLTKEIGNVKADLMKWSFLFWVGAVTAISMLAGVLER